MTSYQIGDKRGAEKEEPYVQVDGVTEDILMGIVKVATRKRGHHSLAKYF